MKVVDLFPWADTPMRTLMLSARERQTLSAAATILEAVRERCGLRASEDGPALLSADFEADITLGAAACRELAERDMDIG